MKMFQRSYPNFHFKAVLTVFNVRMLFHVRMVQWREVGVIQHAGAMGVPVCGVKRMTS